MKKHVLFLIGICWAFLAFSQEEKKLVFDANAQPRSVGSFSGIEISGAISLYLSQGKESAVAVSASDAELLEKIRTVVRNNVLYISLDTKGMSWKKWGNTGIKAYVTFDELTKLEASGACNIKTAGPMKLDELKIQLSGASDFNGEVELENLRVDVSGASQANLKGKAEKAQLIASGASSIKSFDLIANYCKIDASGASSIRVNVAKEISAEASGASSIQYKGEAIIKDFSSSGASSVKRKND
ncbi:head GIN domain-containing protein [Sediminibacterium sp.]|uniref:head GIN domain-containing protein n=1 Tax=Sediminibacterium sp. TaxID=1917865 RepID=UPI003F69CAD1